jgi:hypothetical protein
MNQAIHFDSTLSDDRRRAQIYAGDLFVSTARPSVLALARFAQQMAREAFAPLDPEMAQYEVDAARYAQILGGLKPAFIHDPESKRLVQALLQEFGCDPDETYFDVPRLRSSTSDGFLTTGIAYAWHPHRDTWFSAPLCQINWWLPVFEIESSNAMAFHPNYWNRPVANTSAGYDYYVWNKQHRGAHVVGNLKADDRPLPRATEEMQIATQTRLLCPVGGLISFSGAQMHSSVPNTSGRTRFSIDFRTVHRRDAIARLGAAATDESCTGTTMRDYLRARDLERLPEEVVALYDDGIHAGSGQLIYQATRA